MSEQWIWFISIIVAAIVGVAIWLWSQRGFWVSVASFENFRQGDFVSIRGDKLLVVKTAPGRMKVRPISNV